MEPVAEIPHSSTAKAAKAVARMPEEGWEGGAELPATVGAASAANVDDPEAETEAVPCFGGASQRHENNLDGRG